MALKYSVIEIFANEEARYAHKPLYEAVIDYVRGLKIAARCMVIRGTEACYENGELVTRHILELSYNMPVKIEILLPTAERDRVLPMLQEMVSEGVVGVRELEVYSYRARKSLIPKRIKVRDVMTPTPVKVTLITPVKAVIQLLLSAVFNGAPVVDAEDRPAGIITEGDLIRRAEMPFRLGLLAELGWEKIDPSLESLTHKTAAEIMTRPVITIGVDEPLTAAVDKMLEKEVKRLPVVDESGKLIGMLSRLDIFRTITKESPDWESIQAQQVVVENLRFVADIMHRDAHAVLPETPVEEVIKIIDSNDIQRVAVIDAEGRFMGLISDRDLLTAFSDYYPGLWEKLTNKLFSAEKSQRPTLLGKELLEKTAAEVMRTDRITLREEDRIDEAISLMTAHGLKRLPVVDAEGKFKGMVSRDSLLRTGFGRS